jgi:N-carbamoylputrescine amidase
MAGLGGQTVTRIVFESFELMTLTTSAISEEPQDPSLNSADHWKTVMKGHAAANVSTVSFE